MKIENCWRLKPFEISASSFDCINDDVFQYHSPLCSVLFHQHCEQCKGFFEQKIERQQFEGKHY